ncbi:hypothetical protein GUJ93_ZPchr0013g34523 [Zizania palustris]|uniref:NB-ARC domain-containing protein n=1 Tax=Zizania palustris TaxID=103762 RepID=A0A8J6C2L0_ZIZPA|nr:hypothetical protein GUJ93_ZPchr0013g34523 [Zizania palustris]
MRHKLARKIQAINSRLEDIIQNKSRYKIEEARKSEEATWKASTSISYTHRTWHSLHESNAEIYEKERAELEKALVTQPEESEGEGNQRPLLITVFGKSGIGKTTLVRNIYNKMAKKKHFEVQAMDCFAPYLTAINIMQQIVQQLTEDNKNCPRKEVRKMFQEKFTDKKYLLVIDGEVSSTEWNDIWSCLHGKKESRIVHITQSKPDEPPNGYHVTIELKTLQEDAVMKLFCKKLRQVEIDERYKENIKGKITSITEGLPLSIALLSGLAQSMERPHEWKKGFEYFQTMESKRLDSILSVCFDDLPHELKCCLLYFVAFPANVTIEARILVSIWVAEGFLRPQIGTSMEKIGNFYLKELVARNLVNMVQMDDDSSGNIFVSIQNKVHDFLQFEAREAISFIKVHSDDDIPTLTSSRRLSLQNYTNKYAILAHPLPKLRSIFSQFEQKPKIDEETLSRKMQDIICWSPQQRSAYDRNRNIKSHIKELLHGSEFLRVINMQGIEIGKKLSHAIGNVVHLQYLGITSCSLERISSSIGRLTNLQTLDVRETNVRKLPKAFWMIETLRHVFGFCLELPKQIGNLKHLLTLDSICLKEHKDALEMTLGEMIHLELLVVWNISDSNVEALSSALKKLKNLRTMILHGKIEVSSPFHSLKCMVLDGELQNHLFNTKGMPNLIMLTLMKTKVNQVFIDKLAELRSLAILTLCPGSYTEKELVFTYATFRCLSKLKVDVEELENVEINLKMLPKLQKCEIISHQTHQFHELVMSNEEGRSHGWHHGSSPMMGWDGMGWWTVGTLLQWRWNWPADGSFLLLRRHGTCAPPGDIMGV